MKTIITAAILLCSFSCVSAQTGTTYDRAIGIKFPGGFAVSYKQFLNETQNAEAEVMFWNHGFRLVGLYEFNFDIATIPGLRLYVGPGAHIGFWDNNLEKESNNSKAGFGVDGVIGFDYKLSDLPLDVSLDWQPAVDLIGSTGYGAAGGGLGIRYTF